MGELIVLGGSVEIRYWDVMIVELDGLSISGGCFLLYAYKTCGGIMIGGLLTVYLPMKTLSA